ncbi:hypothetical protein [Streptomyces katrae]|uniref:hypothetical protein n=1 Tax=Streptomyces katrae TaxID=68223 RepID=UPI0004C1018E|nr:hypothetical protein [Streptomyces katrae]
MDDDFCLRENIGSTPLAGDHRITSDRVQEHQDATLENAHCQELNHPPLGAFTEVPDRRGTVIERWTRRLVKSEPTPFHALLVMDGSPVDARFVDPLTGMPVLRSRVYPVPCGSSEQLAWHRWGGKPVQTAAVIDALLDDLGATVDSVKHHAVPKGLSELLGRDHMYRVELGRDVLLEARRSPTA